MLLGVKNTQKHLFPLFFTLFAYSFPHFYFSSSKGWAEAESGFLYSLGVTP